MTIENQEGIDLAKVMDLRSAELRTQICLAPGPVLVTCDAPPALAGSVPITWLLVRAVHPAVSTLSVSGRNLQGLVEDRREYGLVDPQNGLCDSLAAAALTWGWGWVRTAFSLSLKQPPRMWAGGGHEPGYASACRIVRLLNGLLQGTGSSVFAG